MKIDMFSSEVMTLISLYYHSWVLDRLESSWRYSPSRTSAGQSVNAYLISCFYPEGFFRLLVKGNIWPETFNLIRAWLKQGIKCVSYCDSSEVKRSFSIFMAILLSSEEGSINVSSFKISNEPSVCTSCFFSSSKGLVALPIASVSLLSPCVTSQWWGDSL